MKLVQAGFALMAAVSAAAIPSAHAVNEAAATTLPDPIVRCRTAEAYRAGAAAARAVAAEAAAGAKEFGKTFDASRYLSSNVVEIIIGRDDGTVTVVTKAEGQGQISTINYIPEPALNPGLPTPSITWDCSMGTLPNKYRYASCF